MQIISFDVRGSFAAFRDPSVTNNQTVYYIPSKTAVIGLIGAILGIRRGNKLDDIYSKEFLEFYASTKIGICVNSKSLDKITLYTNHRSLEKKITKPVKKELLENPNYTIFVVGDKTQDLFQRIKTNNFVFSPYLGHAYCPAIVSNPILYDGILSNAKSHDTRCVVLDESKPFDTDVEFDCNSVDSITIMVERHLHHFYKDNTFEKKVMRHWIPMGGRVRINDYNSKRELSEFYKLEKEYVCIY